MAIESSIWIYLSISLFENHIHYFVISHASQRVRHFRMCQMIWEAQYFNFPHGICSSIWYSFVSFIVRNDDLTHTVIRYVLHKFGYTPAEQYMHICGKDRYCILPILQNYAFEIINITNTANSIVITNLQLISAMWLICWYTLQSSVVAKNSNSIIAVSTTTDSRAWWYHTYK